MTHRGVTLPELVICLSLIGILAHATLGPVRRQIDWIALRSAREELISLFHRARMEARLRGGARLLVVEGGDPELSVQGRPSPLRVPLAERGIAIDVAGARAVVTFDYGPLGIAQLASATLTLKKGQLESTLVVSGYGRIRR